MKPAYVHDMTKDRAGRIGTDGGGAGIVNDTRMKIDRVEGPNLAVDYDHAVRRLWCMARQECGGIGDIDNPGGTDQLAQEGLGRGGHREAPHVHSPTATND